MDKYARKVYPTLRKENQQSVLDDYHHWTEIMVLRVWFIAGWSCKCYISTLKLQHILIIWGLLGRNEPFHVEAMVMIA